MKLFVAGILAAGLAAAQSSLSPAEAAAAAAAVASVKLPTYIAGGGAYNQFAGANLWGSAILPVSNSVGLYESTTVDLFPVKASLSGRSAYIFQASVREGVHKILSDDGRNMVLIGADAGLSFAQASAGGSATPGVSAALTITYVRQLNPSWALMVPIRALYMPGLGGWNPIAEAGIVWKPGRAK